jgi:hypothetical protein
MTAAQLQKVLRMQRKEVEALERSLSRNVAASAMRTRREILALVNQIDGPVTTANRTAAMQSVRRIVRAAGEKELAEKLRLLPTMVRDGARRASDVTELVLYSRRTNHATVQAFSAFQRNIREEKLFSVAGDKVKAWAEKFGTDWDSGFQSTMRGLQDTFTKGTISGLDWRTISKQITGDAGELMTKGEITGTVERFAEVFARTKVAEIDNMASRQLGEDLGMTLYINCGVCDDGQSEICYDACNAGAMSLEDWAASEYGEPLRHVGCRDSLVPVPFDPKITVDNPKIDEKRAELAAAESE